MDVNSLELTRPRSDAVEQVGLWSMQQLGFMALLSVLGINATQITAIVGSIIARMAAPELAAYGWLGTKSGLGELPDVDYETMPLMSLYRASDVLWKHHTVIEQRLFERVSDLFGFSTTVTLYDLTNTYFEGEATTLEVMLKGLNAPKGALVVMDAGIAT